jgi:hypothetical protein
VSVRLASVPSTSWLSRSPIGSVARTCFGLDGRGDEETNPITRCSPGILRLQSASTPANERAFQASQSLFTLRQVDSPCPR